MSGSHVTNPVRRFSRRVFVGGGLAAGAALTTARGWARDDGGKIASDEAGDVYQAWAELVSPRRGKDKRAGDVLDAASFSVFVPRSVAEGRAVRGATLNPFYEPTVKQTHWRAAAAHWGFVHIGANLFGVRKQEMGETVTRGLAALARVMGIPGIAQAPVCFHGMSAGGGMSATLAGALASRTIAAAPVCLEVGPTDAASRRVPMLTIFGERDGKQMQKLMAKLPEQRRQGALWAIAPQWGRRHEWHRASNLVIAFYDRMIAHRLSVQADDPGAAAGPPTLRPLDDSKGWRADHAAWRTAAPVVAPGPDPNLGWLADEGTAKAWRSFVSYRSPVKLTLPAGMGGGAAFQTHPAAAPIPFKVAVQKGFKANQIAIFSGAQQIAEAPPSGGERVVDGLKPGVHPLFAVAKSADGGEAVSPLSTIIVA